MDDWQLLDEYATRNSEEAFRALVDRYAGMVYHAALRQVRNPHAAQEVTQAVFIALARKAGGIGRQTVLCGWLFRATRFAVLNLVRDEACRRRHEQEAVTMESTIEPHDAESVWEQISPHLNEALDRLSKTDREAVMIRFFGEKNVKEVAQALGVSEDTAKKRLSRALDKLRLIFARRGVVVPSVALAAAFSAFGVQAAPMGLASSVTAAALANGAGATPTLAIVEGILKLMAWAKAKTAIAVGAGVLLAGAGTATVAVKALSTPADDLIGKLERQSGKRIAWDKHLALPAAFDFKNLPLERALDMLSLQAGAYWSIDYAVYGSDQALRQLLDVLREGTGLQDGRWTNLSSRPLRANILVTPYDPHGRPGGGIGGGGGRGGGGSGGGGGGGGGSGVGGGGGRFGGPRKDPGDLVSMVVMLRPEATATFFQDLAQGRGQPASEHQAIIQAMRDGMGEGVLAPERLLAEIRLLSGADLVTPMPATAEAAAQAAKTLHARWTTIYTLRTAPLDCAGIKLVHTGSQIFAAQADMPANPDEFMQRIDQLMRTNDFNLTPEDRAAHQRAVEALKHKP